MSARAIGTDWLYASGALSREDWRRLRPTDPLAGSPLDVLTDRYSRKDISREEFLQMLADLTTVTAAVARTDRPRAAGRPI